MKTRFTVLITLLLLPCLVQGQIISKVPQSDVSVMKNVIGSTAMRIVQNTKTP